VWAHPFFLDMFADRYAVPSQNSTVKPALERMRASLHVLRTALAYADVEDQDPRMKGLVQVAQVACTEAVDLCDRLPARTRDNGKFFAFLATIMGRLRNMTAGDVLMVPTGW
jgi:hypothetical protein